MFGYNSLMPQRRRPMNYRAVLFDFDYTLADSSRGIEDCVNHALAELGLPAASARAVSETVGLSLAETFCRLTGPATPEQCAEFSRHFIARADQVMVDSTMLYDTARTVIPDLKQRGLAIGVLSTKFRRRIAAVLEREKMCGYFDVIVGGEDVANHKPHPEGALKAVAALGAAASEILYVGDSVVDAETARRAQLPFAAVLTGVTSRHAFTSYRPVAVVDSLTAVPGLVSSNSARASTVVRQFVTSSGRHPRAKCASDSTTRKNPFLFRDTLKRMIASDNLEFKELVA